MNIDSGFIYHQQFSHVPSCLQVVQGAPGMLGWVAMVTIELQFVKKLSRSTPWQLFRVLPLSRVEKKRC